MRISDFISRIKDMELPISDGYDIVAWLLDIEYDKAKMALEIPHEKALEVLRMLDEGIPAAYITNRREFYGREFYVDENVLIPRVETEVLVEEALKVIENIKNPKVLDLCTGSGCILLSVLSERVDASGLGVDISAEAIEVAKRNRQLLGVGNRACFKKGDALSFVWRDDDYNIVLCNPPYVTEEEYISSDCSLKYEPKLALTAEDNGLFFYKNILRNISLLCKKDCVAIFEIGHNQNLALKDIANSMGINVFFVKDLAGIDRVMVCLLK